MESTTAPGAEVPTDAPRERRKRPSRSSEARRAMKAAAAAAGEPGAAAATATPAAEPAPAAPQPAPPTETVVEAPPAPAAAAASAPAPAPPAETPAPPQAPVAAPAPVPAPAPAPAPAPPAAPVVAAAAPPPPPPPVTFPTFMRALRAGLGLTARLVAAPASPLTACVSAPPVALRPCDTLSLMVPAPRAPATAAQPAVAAPPRPVPGTGFSASTSLLSVRVEGLDGVITDPYVSRPIVRVHALNSRSGRYYVPPAGTAGLWRPPPGTQDIARATGALLDAAPAAQLRAINAASETAAAMVSLRRGGGLMPGTTAATAGAAAAARAEAATRLATEPLVAGFVEPLSTCPGLHTALASDAAALARAARNGRLSPGAHNLPPTTPAAADAASGGHPTAVVWGETLVFSLPYSATTDPDLVLVFEVLEEAASLPASLARAGGGAHRVAWGFLHPHPREAVAEAAVVAAVAGQQNKTATASSPSPAAVVLGFPDNAAVATALQSSSPSSSFTAEEAAAPELRVCLFRTPPKLSRGQIAKHASTLPPLVSGPAPAPSPLAALFYRLATRTPAAASLRVRVAPAVVPAVRFVLPLERSTVFTYLSVGAATDGAPLSPQTLAAAVATGAGGLRPVHEVVHAPTSVPLPLPPDAVAEVVRGRRGGVAGLAAAAAPLDPEAHPAVGGSPSPLCVSLPCDVFLSRVLGGAAVADAESAAAAGGASAVAGEAGDAASGGGASAAGSSGETGLVLSGRLAKFHRGRHEPCLPPSRFIASLPTGDRGAMVVAFSPNGLLLAVACTDRDVHTIRLYSVETAALYATLRGHGGLIYSLDWSADSQWLLSGSADGTALVWAVPNDPLRVRAASSSTASAARYGAGVSGRPFAVAAHHDPLSYVYAARFLPHDCSKAVTGAYDGGLRLWDTCIGSASTAAAAAASSQAPLPCPQLGFIGRSPRETAAAALTAGVAGVAAAPQPSGSASAGGGHASYVNAIEFDTPALAGSAGAQAASAAAARRASGVAAGAAAALSRVAAAASAGAAAPAPTRMITGDGAGVIIVWSFAAPASPPPPAAPAVTPACFGLLRELRPAILRGCPVVALRVRPGAAQLAVLAHGDTLRLFDLHTYMALRSFSGVRCSARRLGAAFSPDGRYLLAGSEAGAGTVWDVDSGAAIPLRVRVEGSRSTPLAYPDALYGVDWHPHMHAVAVASHGGAAPVILVG